MKKIGLMLAAMMAFAVSAAENDSQELLIGKWQYSNGISCEAKDRVVTLERGAGVKAWIASMYFKVEPGATYNVQAVLNGIENSKGVSLTVRFDKSKAPKKEFVPVQQADKSYLVKGEFTAPADCQKAIFSIWRGKGVAGEKIVVSNYSVKKIK